MSCGGLGGGGAFEFHDFEVCSRGDQKPSRLAQCKLFCLSCGSAGCEEQAIIGVQGAPLAELLLRLHPATES